MARTTSPSVADGGDDEAMDDGAVDDEAIDGGVLDDGEARDDWEDDEIELLLCSRGRGAIGTAASPVLLYAGYPSHCLPDLTHFVQNGLFSSHFTLRILRIA
jgi:hypothetical protein